MKTRLVSLALLIVCFSCRTNNKPLSNAQKEKIQGEIKEVVNTFIKGCEEANSDIILKIFLDSPDFVAHINGHTYSYKESVDGVKSMLSKLKNQKGTIVKEKYTVLDNSCVLYTLNSKWLINLKDGRSILQDPWIVQLLFRNIDKKWRVICIAESGEEQSVKNTETSKEFNQVELVKQFAGTWKSEKNDTINIIEDNMYGDGHEVYLKTETKGKIIWEGKSLIGYDKKRDMLIESLLEHNSANMILWVIRFSSANKFEEIPLEDISNPENAAEKDFYELKSPDLMINTYIKNNKVVSVDTYKRVR